MAAHPNAVTETIALPLGVLLQCPRCDTNMFGLECPLCSFEMQVRAGIVDALPPERVARYERFVEDYESIRIAEGRGSDRGDSYLALPYRDLSGRNSQQWQIRARSFDYFVRHVLDGHAHEDYRRILDLGAGNCWMSYRLALAGYRPFAVDLLTNDRDGLGAAEHYRAHLPELFPRFRAEMGRLPFQSGQFDAVIFNASFHYAENYEMTLGEALRCVRPGGIVAICDTAWYSREESGYRMVRERQAAFLNRYGTASDSIRSQEFMTDTRLKVLEQRLSIRWRVYSPYYGLRWAMRPLIAKLRGRREPSQFRIYVTRKDI